MEPPQTRSPLLSPRVPPFDSIEMSAALGLADGLAVRDGSPRTLRGLDRHLRRPRFSTCYFVYCVVCFLLTSVLLVTTAWEYFAPRREVRFWRRQLRPWEEAVETFVGTALCTETLALMRMVGCRRFLRDRWRIIDALIAGLTLICGIFFLMRRFVRRAGDVVQDIDVPILGLRFALQPVRMFSTASMVVRAHLSQRVAPESEPEQGPPYLVDPRKPCAALSRPILTPALASELRELLPCHLRYVDWELGYSPSVHGTSMSTFYRCQAGPNLVVVRDTQGGLFGGFATQPWRPTAGAYGAGEAFVFIARPMPEEDGVEAAPDEQTVAAVSSGAGVAGAGAGSASPPEGGGGGDGSDGASRVDVFWAVPQQGRIIQWSDSKMLGFGDAVVIFDDFLRGSSGECEAFGSTPLSAAGLEFVIRDFECWQVGTSP
eukprot:CAMPEP_0203901240 /NCGR_PEP_ID=MMETSP0359-20131031/43436_1 /ASSEMBLY_ACC=CAM_ASM_000338 /TAXON_ID=268821 /ORGANISM="Scrippsiella Hangoei, Strain SHTV-5" /LENGTH=430 /DNA_ID=CAMNT_0050824873 /DNA_START=35 /DNA_END=1327 /DNA_ORIENTATION=+